MARTLTRPMTGATEHRRSVGLGMEQFHHPRPVRTGRRGATMPTPQRRRLMGGLTGRVLEIGAGDGVKLTCCPPDVDEIVLVEADPFLRAAAKAVAGGLATSVRIVEGDLTRLSVPEASCDAVVCSLILCRVPSVRETLREVRRVLRPGGELRFYEHQRSARRAIALLEQMATPIWPRLSRGCHPARDVLSAVEEAGFVIAAAERFAFRRFDHVLGTARPL